MLKFPQDTETKVVKINGRREVWSRNPTVSCPYCSNTTIWTRLLTHQETKQFIFAYNNSPHFCGQCLATFILHHQDLGGTKEAMEHDNRTRALALGKDKQLSLNLTRQK